MALTTLANKHFNLNTSLILTDGNNNPLTYDWQLYGETRDGVLRIEHFKIQNNTVIYYDHFNGDTVVYQNGAWVNDDYRYINIEQGADVETSSALSWFDTNAVEIIFNFPISYNLTGLTAYGENIGDTRPTIISEGTDVYITLVPDTDYGLPANITVDGCAYSYNNTYGTITLSNPYANVTLTAVGTFHKIYNIDRNLSHVTYIGDTTIETDGTATGTLYADVGYFLPETVTVTGCSYTYNKNTGVITFSNPPHSSAGVMLTAIGSEIDTSDLTLVLYNNLSERNRVMKTITLIGTLTGTLREESSMLKPTVTIEYNKVPDFNYVQIPNYKRYYYVNNVVSVRKNIWRLELSIDVLMSFYLLIANLQCFVTRNEYDYNSLIVDNKLPSTNKDNYTIINPTADSSFDIYHNYTRYVFSSSGIYNGSWVADWQYRKTFPCSDKYLIDASNLQILFNEMNGDNFTMANLFANDPLEALLSLRAYPFDVESVFNMSSSSTMKLHIGSWESITAVGKWCGSRADNQIGVNGGRFYITSTNWKDYEADYSLYIPYVGFIDLKGYQFLNKYLLIWYDVDYDTGMGQASLYVSDTLITVRTQGMKPFASYPCQISVNIPMTQSNVREQVKTALDMVGIGLLALGGITATAVTGGALSPALLTGMAAAEGAQVGRLTKHITRGNTGASSWITNFIGVNPFIIKTIPDYYTPTNYAHLFGYPLNETRILSNVHGYTEVGEVHLEYLSGVMVEECAEIGRLLQQGVILP